jgi:hypothetical protein
VCIAFYFYQIHSFNINKVTTRNKTTFHIETHSFTMVHPPGLRPQRSGIIRSFIHLHQVIVLHITLEVHMKCTCICEADQCHTKLHNLQPNPQLQSITLSPKLTQYYLHNSQPKTNHSKTHLRLTLMITLMT